MGDGLAFDGTTLYYLSGSWDGNALYALDPASGPVGATFILPALGFRSGLACLNGLVYILERGSLGQYIPVLNPETGTIADKLDFDGANLGAPRISGGIAGITNPDALLVTTALTNEVLELDPVTAVITSRFAHGRMGTLGVATAYDLIFLGANTSRDLQVFIRGGELMETITIPDSVGVQSLGGDNVLTGYIQVFLPMVAR